MDQIIDRQELKQRFLYSLQRTDYRLIEGINPIHIEISGKEYWVYIKKLTSAHFTNPDVWRAQLPLRDIFNTIKESDTPFVLFGYDIDNDVYAVWNPLWVKQRLNSTENVSLYSRYHIQEEARKKQKIIRIDLDNDGEVVIFPREKTIEFIDHMQTYYVNTDDYVALGSKRRQEANESYKIFTSLSNLDDFTTIMRGKGYTQSSINNYCRAIKILIKDGYISRNKKVFLQYNSLKDYINAIPQFVKIPEIQVMEEKWHGVISIALRLYILALETIVSKEESQGVAEENTIVALFDDQIQPETIFQRFVSFKDLDKYKERLAQKGYTNNTIWHYERALQYLKKHQIIEKYDELFIKYQSYLQYPLAIKAFFQIPENKKLNISHKRDFSAAMNQYVDFLISCNSYPILPDESTKDEEPEPYDNLCSQNTETQDWESKYTDENGKLTKITNPDLLKKLQPVLDREYPNTAAAYNIIENFYKDRYSSMQLYEWGKLIKEIDWRKPLHPNYFEKTQRKRSGLFEVHFPDGYVLREKSAVETFKRTLDKIGLERIPEVGIVHSGYNLVDKRKRISENNNIWQHKIGNWYIYVNISNEKKTKDLLAISDYYNLGLQIVSAGKVYKSSTEVSHRVSKENVVSNKIDYKELLVALRRGGTIDGASNAKPVLLLSILALIEDDLIKNNRIYYNSNDLEVYYELIFESYEPDKTPTPLYMPFYYLSHEPFYHLKWKDDSINVDKPTKKTIQEQLDYAYLDDSLWVLLNNADFRDKARSIIVEKYFGGINLGGPKETKVALGDFSSWTVQSDNVIIKHCDKSVFEHHGTAIDNRTRSFWNVDHFDYPNRLEITLRYDNNDYYAYIEIDVNQRTRMFWGTDLKRLFDKEYSETGGYPNLRFERLGKNKYEVIFIHKK